MNFQDAVRSGFTKYADFNGCATRPEFWWWFLFTIVASALLSSVSQSAAGLFSIATLLPSIAVATRRLHDIDRSGWFQLLYLVPLVGIIILIVWYAQPAKRPSRFC